MNAADLHALIDRYRGLRAEAREDAACPGLALDFAADAERAYRDLAAALAEHGPVEYRGEVWEFVSKVRVRPAQARPAAGGGHGG